MNENQLYIQKQIQELQGILEKNPSIQVSNVLIELYKWYIDYSMNIDILDTIISISSENKTMNYAISTLETMGDDDYIIEAIGNVCPQATMVSCDAIGKLINILKLNLDNYENRRQVLEELISNVKNG